MRASKYFIAAIALIGFTSCEVFERDGCPDSYADNYDAKADRNDYSCIYSTEGVFYWGNNTQSNFQNNGITHITIVAEGETVVQNTPVASYATAAMQGVYSCQDTAWIEWDKKYYGNNHSVRVDLFDQNDSLFHSEKEQYSGICTYYRIDY